jgi:uncharacterized protein (DUF1778 family)
MSSATTPQATSRLEARISAEVKALVLRAAELEGRSLTDFVSAAIAAEACRVIERHKSLLLNLADSEAFVEALLNPPQPNEALKAAAERYRQLIDEKALVTNDDYR